METPEVNFDDLETEPILYNYGPTLTTLTGFWAWLYRGMIPMYGEFEAKARVFEYMLACPTKKEKEAVSAPQLNTAEPEWA